MSRACFLAASSSGDKVTVGLAVVEGVPVAVDVSVALAVVFGVLVCAVATVALLLALLEPLCS